MVGHWSEWRNSVVAPVVIQHVQALTLAGEIDTRWGPDGNEDTFDVSGYFVQDLYRSWGGDGDVGPAVQYTIAGPGGDYASRSWVDIAPPDPCPVAAPLEGLVIGVDYILIPGHDPSEGESAYVDYQLPRRSVPYVTGGLAMFAADRQEDIPPLAPSGVATLNGGLGENTITYTPGVWTFPDDPLMVNIDGSVSITDTCWTSGLEAIHTVFRHTVWGHFTGIQVHNGEPYRLWLPDGIPPLRQRARNDGMATDTRQEVRQLAPSQMLVPTQWWVGAPGPPPDGGGGGQA